MYSVALAADVGRQIRLEIERGRGCSRKPKRADDALKQVTILAAAKQVGRLTISRRTRAATTELGDHTNAAAAASTHLGQETEDRAIHRGHQATKRDEKGRSRIGLYKQHNTPESSRKRPKNPSFFTRFEPPVSPFHSDF